MENSRIKKPSTRRMIIALLIIGVLMLWFFSSQFESLPEGVKPQFSSELRSLSGEPLDSILVKGKPIVVNFWATWCPPCIDELPGFVRLSKKLRDEVQFLGLAVDSPLTEVVRFQAQFQIPYTIAMANWATVSAWKAEQLPMTYLLSADGQIVWSHRGGVSEQELTASIEKFTKPHKSLE